MKTLIVLMALSQNVGGWVGQEIQNLGNGISDVERAFQTPNRPSYRTEPVQRTTVTIYNKTKARVLVTSPQIPGTGVIAPYSQMPPIQRKGGRVVANTY